MYRKVQFAHVDIQITLEEDELLRALLTRVHDGYMELNAEERALIEGICGEL